MAIMGVTLERPEPVEAPEDISLDEVRLERTLKIEYSLFFELRGILISLLKEFQDVFAHRVEEMPEIDPEIAVHRLNVHPGLKPVC